MKIEQYPNSKPQIKLKRNKQQKIVSHVDFFFKLEKIESNRRRRKKEKLRRWISLELIKNEIK